MYVEEPQAQSGRRPSSRSEVRVSDTRDARASRCGCDEATAAAAAAAVPPATLEGGEAAGFLPRAARASWFSLRECVRA